MSRQVGVGDNARPWYAGGQPSPPRAAAPSEPPERAGRSGPRTAWSLPAPAVPPVQWHELDPEHHREEPLFLQTAQALGLVPADPINPTNPTNPVKPLDANPPIEPLEPQSPAEGTVEPAARPPRTGPRDRSRQPRATPAKRPSTSPS